MSITPASGSAAVVSPRRSAPSPWARPWRTQMSSRRARRLMVSSCRSARARVGLPAPTSTSGILAPAGTFISERTERTSLMSLTSQPISSSAVGVGEPLEHRPGVEAQQVLALHAAPRPVRAHSSSVMNGMNGCSSFRIWSSTQAVVARVSALAASSLAVEHRLDQLEIPVAERAPDELVDGAGRLVELVGLDAGRDGRRRALDLAGDPAVDGLLDAPWDRSPSARTHSFISAKRAAFQSLVAKLR